MKVLIVLCFIGVSLASNEYAPGYCDYDGYRPDSDGKCERFEQCSNGKWAKQDCPYGLWWSQAYLKCVYPKESECGKYGDHAPGYDAGHAAPAVGYDVGHKADYAPKTIIKEVPVTKTVIKEVKVPYVKEVPVVKEVPYPVVKYVTKIRDVPVVKHQPVVKYVHVPKPVPYTVIKNVPVYKKVPIYKKVTYPVHTYSK